MQTVLHKYSSNGQDYLIFDIRKNGMALSSRGARQICAQHFGIGSAAIVTGPFDADGSVRASVYRPDGTVTGLDGRTAPVFAKYLADAGYLGDSMIANALGSDMGKGTQAEEIGKIFFFETI